VTNARVFLLFLRICDKERCGLDSGVKEKVHRADAKGATGAPLHPIFSAELIPVYHSPYRSQYRLGHLWLLASEENREMSPPGGIASVRTVLLP
jgi:hypothetical protein